VVLYTGLLQDSDKSKNWSDRSRNRGPTHRAVDRGARTGLGTKLCCLLKRGHCMWIWAVTWERCICHMQCFSVAIKVFHPLCHSSVADVQNGPRYSFFMSRQ